MNAGEIGTDAGRVFEYNLPISWIYRSQEDQNDFGIDGEVELKDKHGKAQGKETIFKVQIKGEEHSTYINEGRILSFTLKIERLRYYFEFKVPVILFVVEVSSEKVFWLPITNDENLRAKAFELSKNESIQIHIPIENRMIRKNNELSDKMMGAVIDSWDYLTIKGLKESVTRYPSVTPSLLNKKIEDIGDVLFKAYHQQLNNFLFEMKYSELFKQARNIFSSSIVPAKDKFVALLYYYQAFQLAPYSNVRREIYLENFRICKMLIILSREQKSRVHRLIALGKTRRIKFKVQIDQLHATHNSIANFEKKSLEHLIINTQTQSMYRDCCISLQKIIELCSRLTKDGQYHIFADLFLDVFPLISIFKSIHSARGAKESIDFLDNWHKNMTLIVMTYFLITEDFSKIERLYLMNCSLLEEMPVAVKDLRELILSTFPDLDPILDEVEKYIKGIDMEKDFFSLTTEEQKSFFSDTAKSLGMDPDDLESEFGRIVRMGLNNYDPTDIMKNCEELFVHYRPGGIIAQSLGMHSVGGMHLLICLKHRYASATGNLLTHLYDNSNGPNFGLSFKQQFCDKCHDCKPRDDNWAWSLKWYEGAVKDNEQLLSMYGLSSTRS